MNAHYLDGDYHKKTDETLSKEEFLERMKIWLAVCKGAMTLGNLRKMNNNTVLFKLRLDSTRVLKVHADTTRAALREFRANKDNPWKVTNGPKTGRVLTNSADGGYISGLYIYE